MLTALVLLCLGAFLLYLLLRIQRPKSFPPGPAPVPVFGNLLQLNRINPLKDFDKFAQHYGSIYGIYIGSQPAVVLTGQKMIKEALITQGHEFAGRSDNMMFSHVTGGKALSSPQTTVYEKLRAELSERATYYLDACVMRTFVGLGVIMADYGESWREHRRFALTTLRNFGLGKKSMEQRILEEVKHICLLLDESAGKSIDPQHLYHQAASNIIASVIFGSRFSYQDEYFQTLIITVEDLTKIIIGPWAMLFEIAPVLRIFPLPFHKAFQYFEKITKHVLKVVEEHRKSQVSGEPRDLIDCYLDEMKKRSDQRTTFDESQMVTLLFDLFIAGTETTSNTLRTLTLYLMTHTHIQEQCQQEIDEVLGTRDHVTYEDRNAMHFVQAVIHEGQRIADIAPLSMFHTTRTDTQLRGYSIPKGTIIIPYLSSSLREESQWKFPYEFNPQNFLNEKGEFVKNDAFMPFSAGPRVCLGENLARMELFLILVTVLRRFRLVWPKNAGEPDFTYIYGGTQSVKPYRMIVEPRKHGEACKSID